MSSVPDESLAQKRLHNIEQAIREFNFSNGSTAEQLVAWLESTTHFTIEEEHTDDDKN